jgi:hypothetical protein
MGALPDAPTDETIKFVELKKSLKTPFSVIPVKTGIQYFQKLGRSWIPACAGMTTFYETIKFGAERNSSAGKKRRG